jgi:hypothetical protein
LLVDAWRAVESVHVHVGSTPGLSTRPLPRTAVSATRAAGTRHDAARQLARRRCNRLAGFSEAVESLRYQTMASKWNGPWGSRSGSGPNAGDDAVE